MNVGGLLAIGCILMLVGLMWGWGKPDEKNKKKGKHKK